MAMQRPTELDHTVSFRVRASDREALQRLVDMGIYASPSHAFRRAIQVLLAMHGISAHEATNETERVA